jgi:uncharacterized membrane protein YcaP (DUF421 family)
VRSPANSVTDQLGTSPAAAVQVVLATSAIYLIFVVLSRVLALAGTDMACVISLGAVVGRTALLAVPTLAAGVLALVVLFRLQRIMATFERRPRLGRFVARGPVVLMSGGVLDEKVMRRLRVTSDDLRQSLWIAGITRRDQVSLAVLERSGRISILRSGVELEPWRPRPLRGSGRRRTWVSSSG